MKKLAVNPIIVAMNRDLATMKIKRKRESNAPVYESTVNCVRVALTQCVRVACVRVDRLPNRTLIKLTSTI